MGIPRIPKRNFRRIPKRVQAATRRLHGKQLRRMLVHERARCCHRSHISTDGIMGAGITTCDDSLWVLMLPAAKRRELKKIQYGARALRVKTARRPEGVYFGLWQEKRLCLLKPRPRRMS